MTISMDIYSILISTTNFLFDMFRTSVNIAVVAKIKDTDTPQYFFAFNVQCPKLRKISVSNGFQMTDNSTLLSLSPADLII